jgi:hypothetical protein
MWALADESSGYLIGLYRRACEHADGVIDDLDLDAPARVAQWPETSRNTTLGFCWSGWPPRPPTTRVTRISSGS